MAIPQVTRGIALSPAPALSRHPAPLRARPWARVGSLELGLWVALALTLVYGVLFGTVSILSYEHFGMGGDLADYVQILWNTAHGRLMQITNIGAPGNSWRGGHSEPILLLLAIPYALIPDPRTILVLQTLAIASGGPLVYALARLHGHRALVAVALVAFYFAIPHTQYANLHQFHPDPLAVPALFGALLAFDLRRWRPLAVCVFFTLIVKEQMVLFVAGLGLYWWLGRGERRIGLLTIGAAALYALAVLLPWYLATASQYASDYSSFFGDMQRAVSGHAGHGGALVARLQAISTLLADPTRRTNILLALLPTGLLFLLDASALIVLLPLAGLFMGDQQINAIWFHHYVTCVPVFLYGTSRALCRPALARRAGALSLLLVAWALVLGYFYAAQPISLMHWIYQPSSAWSMSDHERAQAAFVRAVPPTASLDADAPLASQLANRTTLYRLWHPREVLYAQYVLYDFHAEVVDPGPWLGMELKVEHTIFSAMQRYGGYRLIRADRRYGLVLYADCGRFPALSACGVRRTP